MSFRAVETKSSCFVAAIRVVFMDVKKDGETFWGTCVRIRVCRLGRWWGLKGSGLGRQVVKVWGGDWVENGSVRLKVTKLWWMRRCSRRWKCLWRS